MHDNSPPGKKPSKLDREVRTALRKSIRIMGKSAVLDLLNGGINHIEGYKGKLKKAMINEMCVMNVNDIDGG
jgi:hypothetical protein